MKIKIFGAESLGVRGLSCSVELEQRKIFIDPGIALGWLRHGLQPHPFQIAAGARIRKNIVAELKTCTDIIISHFHGDHCPLYNANQYQLRLDDVKVSLTACRIWVMEENNPQSVQLTRRDRIEESLGRQLINASGKQEGPIEFSIPVPHGRQGIRNTMVMMTRIEEGGEIFVHASDIQLTDRDTVDIIIGWKPDTVLVSGPPLYHYSSSESDSIEEAAWGNAIRLSGSVGTLIVDHHLLRSEEGIHWFEKLRKKAHCRVVCAAEFMGQEPLYLEAWRQKLYEQLPVPEGWHEYYKEGIVSADEYFTKGIDFLKTGEKQTRPISHNRE